MCHRASAWIACGLLLLLTSEISVEEPVLREQLFARADRAMLAANEALANVLAPISNEQGAWFYRDVEIVTRQSY